MNRFAFLVIGMVLGGLLTVGAQSYHIVHADNGLNLVQKRHASLSDTYIDVRHWGIAEWAQHPDLLWSLHQSQKSDVLGDTPVLNTNVRDVSNAFQQQFGSSYSR